MNKIIFIIPFILLPLISGAQLDEIGKKVTNRINNRIERGVNNTIDKSIDKAGDSVEDAISGKSKTKKKQDNKNEESSVLNALVKDAAPSGNNGSGEKKEAAKKNESASGFNYSTNFDFVPGNDIIVLDDFTSEYVGDFPSSWNTNGSGEIVKSESDDIRWFRLQSGSTYIPDLPAILPNNFTIEFDLATKGLSPKTSRVSYLSIMLSENNTFIADENYGTVKVPFCQSVAVGISVNSKSNGEDLIKNEIESDVRQRIKNPCHISIAVNKTRYRFYLNETKLIDIPRFLPENKIKYLKFNLKDLSSELGEYVFIKDLKIASGGEDIRKKIIEEGHISLNGILFNVNSDIVRPESYGILRNVWQVLDNNSSIKIIITGHTDSDGEANFNMDLSKRRAEAVKKILSEEFKVEVSRITTEGKGESEPIEANNTNIKKASNRRVEFTIVK